jgi:hypothetical protein
MLSIARSAKWPAGMESVDELLEEQARREARNLLTIWGALAASVAVYVFLGSIFAGDRDPPALHRAVVHLGSLQFPLSGVRMGMICLALALLMGCAWVAKTRLGERAILANSIGRTAEDRVRSGFAYLKRFSIAAWIMAQTVILLGTLWSMMSGRVLEIFPFAVAGAVGLLMMKPEELPLLGLAREMANAPQQNP